MADAENGRIVIIGAGFAGLEAAKRLARAGLRVTVVDRRNHHLFQPLLYQVATAALSPADIATPIRRILGRYPNVDVLMDSVQGFDRAARTVLLSSGRTLAYDRLIVATGARDTYFGNEGWRARAPGLKSVEDALAIRSRMLEAFECAEVTTNADERARLLTFVIVGGGPTGIEMAGAMAELARRTLRREFHHVRPENARIILIEAGDRLLSPFTPEHSAYVAEKLARRGVAVKLGSRVEAIDHSGITFGGEVVETGTIFWAAGVAASPVGALLDTELDKAGRVVVSPDLSLPGDPRVFVLGDLAAALDEDGKPLPGLAQVARQQGAHVGRALAQGRKVAPFRYRSRGNTAIVGRNAAVYESERLSIKGFAAWLLWALIHVYLLIGFQSRVMVTLQWVWRYLTAERRSRLILDWPRPVPRDEPD